MSEKSEYYCPFCAWRGRVIDFRLLKRGGEISNKKSKCPDCNAVMLRRTLTRKMTPREWARWLYVSIREFGEKFYIKIKWERLWNRLWEFGFGDEFLLAWKDIKSQYGEGVVMSKEINDILTVGLNVITRRRLSEWMEN